MMRTINALVGIVSRVPARVEIKLLTAFLAIEVLLVVMGAVSLDVLSGVNQRTDELIKLQRKIEAYRQVQHDTTTQLYGVSSALLSSDDLTLTGALRQLNQFGYDVDRLQFVAKDEVDLLDRFRQDYDRFTNIVTDVVELIRAGRAGEAREMQAAQAAPLADRLERLTNQLVNKAEVDLVTGIEASNQAYVTSQWTVTGFALGSIMLAVILGYTISRSLIGPLTEVETRLKQIAAGDFSQRVYIVNRDELGTLATNVNRTSEELGRLYQQLEAANLAKSRFLAAASHDLRQPLHALNLFVAQLRRETDQAEQARLVKRIDASVAAMNELFNALLDISKLDAGVVAPSVSEFPVDHLLKRIEMTFAAAAREKGLRLRVVSSGVFIRSDFILLERILLNLVSNAIRYTVRGGIVVGCLRRGGVLRIEVWDSGIGIPEDQRANVFREFYQLSAAEGDRSDGLGLGLAIVERLCRLLDHPIELMSRLGKGSRFTVVVPITLAHRLIEKTPQAAIDRAIGKLVVVIDDDALVLDGMRGILKSWGCSVVTANSEAAAIAYLAEHERTPDLIISDYRLADGNNGIQAIEQLRKLLRAAVPAFLISGDTAPERLREASASGFYLLHKPVLPMQLRATISQLLRERVETERAAEMAAIQDSSNGRQSAAAPIPAYPPR
jgi:signal transduction histidine kinase/DNA-binding NarL/FixJ family response regulator